MNRPDLPVSPAADRNKEPILEVLRAALPAQAAVLEIAAGTGQHAAHFAAACPAWTWQPTDADESLVAAIAARCAGLPNVRPPLRLDLLAPWPAGLGRCDAVYCANLLHISPWATCAALMRLAGQHLAPTGLLVLYGPYFVDGEPAAPGNLAFDAALRAQDANWGVRRLGDVVEQARQTGLVPDQRIAMPANNLCLAFRRAP